MVTRRHMEARRREPLHGDETCRDMVSRPFLGSYFKVVYKVNYVHLGRDPQLYTYSVNSRYLRI